MQCFFSQEGGRLALRLSAARPCFANHLPGRPVRFLEPAVTTAADVCQHCSLLSTFAPYNQREMLNKVELSGKWLTGWLQTSWRSLPPEPHWLSHSCPPPDQPRVMWDSPKSRTSVGRQLEMPARRQSEVCCSDVNRAVYPPTSGLGLADLGILNLSP